MSDEDVQKLIAELVMEKGELIDCLRQILELNPNQEIRKLCCKGIGMSDDGDDGSDIAEMEQYVKSSMKRRKSNNESMSIL